MKLSKSICGGLIVASMIIIPTPQAEAGGFFKEIGNFMLEVLIDDPEAFARKNSDEVLEALWKSAVLMEESKLCLAEALELNPKDIAASQEALRAMTFDRRDMKAIRRSTYHELPEDELRSKTAKLLTIEDQSRYESISKLLKRSKDARSAAHAYNEGALGHIAKAFFHIGQLRERDPYAADRAMDYLMSRITDSEDLLNYQKQQSRMFHQTLDIVEKKWNIKEPSKSERKKIEKEILPQ